MDGTFTVSSQSDRSALQGGAPPCLLLFYCSSTTETTSELDFIFPASSSVPMGFDISKDALAEMVLNDVELATIMS